MKLDNKNSINLLCNCCIVKEIQNTQKNNDYLAEQFNRLKKYIKNSNNVNFKELHENFDDNKSIENFLNNMEQSNKKAITINYYKKAVQAAKEHDPLHSQNLTEPLKNKFFKENGLITLRNNKKMIDRRRFVSAIALTGMTGLGAFLVSRDEPVKPQPQIETTETPEATSAPITTIDSLDINDAHFKDKIIEDFKSFYADEYNKSRNSNISTDDFKIKTNEHQNYIYQIKVGNEYRYVSHGNHPDRIEQYFANNQITPTVIEDCEAISIYATDENGEKKIITDEFGNQSSEKIDSIIQVKNPDTGNLEYVKLYDGNNPEGLVNPKSSSNSILKDLSEIATILSSFTNSETDKENLKATYIKQVSKFERNHTKNHKELER